ncbi:hypothetical protein ACOSP7_021998 [Xanthoceras sorbifolium]
MFAGQIGRTMEVYVDDMLTKSLTAEKHARNLRETFKIHRQHKMKLNLEKCIFGVASGKFLGFLIHQRGIKANPEKIDALIKMKPPRNLKEFQHLTGCLSALNRFITRSIDKCLPFFKAIKKGKGVEWTEECDHAFHQLKTYLGSALVLSKPLTSETLYLYLSVTTAATNFVLIQEENGVQNPVYYVSKALIAAETRYSNVEKMALALIVAAHKLRPYFQAHSIEVLTNCPLKQMLQKPEVSGRLTKWAIELSEFGLKFKPRTAIKGQAVADFIAEFIEQQIDDRLLINVE